MTKLISNRLTRFLKNEEGVTAVECALMLALVIVICLVALAPATESDRAAPSTHIALESNPR